MLIDALGRAGLCFVLAKHEKAAGIMAKGVHHADGCPGVLVATLGPGVAHAADVVPMRCKTRSRRAEARSAQSIAPRWRCHR